MLLLLMRVFWQEAPFQVGHRHLLAERDAGLHGLNFLLPRPAITGSCVSVK